MEVWQIGISLRQALRNGKLCLGVSVMVPSPQIVEMIAALGFDWVLIDCEHGAIGPETLELMAMAARSAGIAAIARPAAGTPQAVLQVMDRGVQGIQVPHVGSREEAARIVEAVKYHPQGTRSLAVGIRSADYGFGLAMDAYVRQANEESLVCVQVEDVDALAQIEAIASVPGIDVVFVGPSDLSQSLGYPGQKSAEPVRRAMHDAFSWITGSGMVAGTAGGEEALRAYAVDGVRYFYTHLTTLLETGARAVTDLARESINRDGI